MWRIEVRIGRDQVALRLRAAVAPIQAFAQLSTAEAQRSPARFDAIFRPYRDEADAAV